MKSPRMLVFSNFFRDFTKVGPSISHLQRSLEVKILWQLLFMYLGKRVAGNVMVAQLP